MFEAERNGDFFTYIKLFDEAFLAAILQSCW